MFGDGVCNVQLVYDSTIDPFMSPEEEANAEALRRIREAENTEATHLDLSKLNSLRELPGKLEQLTSLRSLDLSRCNQLSDLTTLAGLTALQKLNLSRCEGLSDLTPLAKLTSLEWLDLSECFMFRGDLSPLAQLTSLQSLDLSGCWNLSGDLSPLAKFTSLKSLNLSGCLLDAGSGFGALDLSPLAGLTSLEFLALEDWNLYRISPLANLTKLQSLDLSNCLFSDDLSTLAQLTSLRSLRFSRSGLYDLSLFADLTLLQSLDLSRCDGLRGDLSPLAKLTFLQSLNLSSCRHLDGDLSPLAGLTALQELDLSGCEQLSDLGPLAGLTSLQTLDLSSCGSLRDLGPLAALTSLQELNLTDCRGVRWFDSLKPLLQNLKKLYLFGCKFEDLPSEVCGELESEDVSAKVRAHYEDLKSGQRLDAEVKVLFLGNGGTGKTQLCRRLRNLDYDSTVPSTHGIQLGEKTIAVEGFPEPVRLNLWDFGGQEIYHGSHTLFLQGQAVFLILWTPELEKETRCHEGDPSFCKRPLSYWLDYLRAFAGVDSPVLLIQSQCDTPAERAPLPNVDVDDFTALQRVQVSAKTGLGLDLVTATLKEAARDCLYRRPPTPIGAGRVRVRDRLRQMFREDQQCEPSQRKHRLLDREEFDCLCAEVGGISNPEALLDFLHHTGVIFYRIGLFGGRIVLDQNWALEAIYALFDRKKILPLLRGYGRFSRADLEALIWSSYTPEEQQTFLGMMESCGICFKALRLSDEEWEYIAPELLPEWAGAQEQLLGRLRDEPPTSEYIARYPFLHEGILRSYLSRLGGQAKDAAVYWKYGCWFYEQTTRSQVLIESQWNNVESEFGPGIIRLRTWGNRADDLIQSLLHALQSLPVGQPPEIGRIHNATGVINTGVGLSSYGTVGSGASRLENLDIRSRPDLPPKARPEIFISYAWGDDSSEDARKRGEVVERLCKTLAEEGWNIILDKNAMRSCDLISDFMKRIGRADLVIVVLSDKYLRSTYCMTELHAIYQRSNGQKEEFLRRIIPIVLNDARINEFQHRDAYAEIWTTQFKTMDQSLTKLAGEQKLSRVAMDDFRRYKEMQKWYLDVADILAYINDVLTPHGFDEIMKDDFAALRQMLQRARSELHS